MPEAASAEEDEFITIPKKEFDSMKRTIQIMEDEKAMEMIEESEKAIEEGKTKTAEQLREELGH